MPLPPGFGPLWVTVAIDLIGFGIVLPILPRYAEDLEITPTVIGFLVASYSIAQMIFSPLLGRLSDRIGRKPVLILSLCGTAAGSLLTGLAGTVWLLFLGRIVDGASGASVSVAQAAVADVATPEERPRLLGLLGAAFGVGFVVGPAIGTLAALGGPHIPFLVAALISSTNALVAARRLPETHPMVRARPAEPIDGPAMEIPPSADGRGGSMPRGARQLLLVAFMALFAFSGFETTFSLLMKDRFDFTLSSTGAVFTVIGLALVLVQGGLIHPVHGRLGERGTLRIGLVLNAVGLCLLAADGQWLTLVPALGLLVLGQGLLTPTMSSAVAAQAGPADRGRLLGYQQSAGALARALGPAAAGALYGRVGIPAPYLFGAALVAVAFALVPRPAAVVPVAPVRGEGAAEPVVT
jgi:multidrug resistance protein